MDTKRYAVALLVTRQDKTQDLEAFTVNGKDENDALEQAQIHANYVHPICRECKKGYGFSFKLTPIPHTWTDL